jgi:hypothetical protein
MALAGKTFRIFVSSTFGDLQEERNALQKNVFPELRELCRRHGCRFQAIDLRWGVREEAGLDQQTMRICLGEIERCQRISPRPNFIVLLGDRYGWRPAPYEIPADEYAGIRDLSDSGEDRRLLDRWYERDDNAVPPVYVLRPRTLEFEAGAGDAEKERTREEERASWQRTEGALRGIFARAVPRMALADDRRVKYLASATEQEIAAGAMRVDDAVKHVFCFFRKIVGLPEDRSAGAFVDLGDDGRVDRDARARLDDLKSRLKNRLPGNVIDSYVAAWDGARPTTSHLDALCADVLKHLSAVIRDEIRQLQDSDPVEQEAADHAAFGRDRARIFYGRDESLRAIESYVGGAEGQPLAVYGASGSGKSALMAVAAERTGGRLPGAVIVSRFIGATSGSTDGRALIEGLCREISRRYASDESSVPSEYKELVEDLPKRLALATAAKPLVLFVDALDQLSNSHGERSLAWLPARLPEHARLVVSTAPGDCSSALERRGAGAPGEMLAPMTEEDGREILDLWMKNAGRTLRPDQRGLVLERFRAFGLPLYLKLAFEEARLWRSFSAQPTLSSDIPGIIRDLLSRLSLEANHGKIVVARSLGYLKAAKNGLSEDELLDLLSADEDVFADFTRRSYHRPPEKQLPVVVWSRLFFDIEPYLIERSADGTALLGFFHRQMAEAVDEEFLAGEHGPDLHAKIARYFAAQPLFLEGGGEKVANLRKLSELPYQQTCGGLWDPLYKTLTDFEFLEAKCTYSGTISAGRGGGSPKIHGGVYELIEDFRRALAAHPAETADA